MPKIWQRHASQFSQSHPFWFDLVFKLPRSKLHMRCWTLLLRLVEHGCNSVLQDFNDLAPPVCAQLSLAIPFYGTINSLFSAFSIGITAFCLPTLAFTWHYRLEANRLDCPVQPPWCVLPLMATIHACELINMPMMLVSSLSAH